MLYQAIRRGSKLYRSDKDLSGSNDCYLALLSNMDQDKWNQPDNLDECEVEKVRKFVAGTWKTRNMQAKTEHLLPVLKDVLPELNKLRGKNLLDICMDEKICGESTADLICRSFKKLANCSKQQNEPTAASKILHIINPKSFVPWDGAIIRGYGGYSRRLFYTDFLRRMQRLANYAISQIESEFGVCRDEAIARLKCEGHTLAKTLDEYNYMKFTKNCDAVWKAEYESCSSPPDVR